MNYLYFLILFCSVIIPFSFAFHPKLNFYKNFGPAILSILIVSCPFILWDIYFTSIHVWGFNNQYIYGIFIYNLPLEEILFFICIPFCCLFTHHSLKIINQQENRKVNVRYICICVGLILLLVGLIYWNRIYTLGAFSLAGITLIMLGLKTPHYLYSSIISYLVLLLPFLIVNGILTGTGIEDPVVWYDNTKNSGIRILTIPVEDFFYGMTLILWNIILFETVLKKIKNAKQA